MKCLLTFIMVLLLFGCNHKAEKAELMSKVEALTAERDSLVNLKNQLESKLDSINIESSFWFDNEQAGKELSEMGIKNPEEFIIKSLMQKPQLIPTEGVLGGQMKFMHVKLLENERLIAYYEDGHTGGRAIYSYRLNNGKLDFKLLESFDE